MVVVALLSVDLVESVDLVSVELVVNCIICLVANKLFLQIHGAFDITLDILVNDNLPPLVLLRMSCLDPTTIKS